MESTVKITALESKGYASVIVRTTYKDSSFSVIDIQMWDRTSSVFLLLYSLKVNENYDSIKYRCSGGMAKVTVGKPFQTMFEIIQYGAMLVWYSCNKSPFVKSTASYLSFTHLMLFNLILVLKRTDSIEHPHRIKS